jgi:hypothetical protein
VVGRGGYAGSALLEPAGHLGLVEETPPFDLVGGELMTGRESIDLLRLAAQDGCEFVDGEEGG